MYRENIMCIPTSLVLIVSESTPTVSTLILITVQSGVYGTVRGLEA